MWVAAGAVALALLAALFARSGGDESGQTGAAESSTAAVGGDVHSLVADPATPGRLFVGGHDAVFTSDDRGRTWSRVRSLDGADAMGWSITGRDVYVSGHPGLSRSTDGGSTFRHTNDGLPHTDVHAFGASGSTLYAAGPGLGITASIDGGRTWAVRGQDEGQSFFGRILVDDSDDQRLVAADARGGAVESADGGRTWRPLGGPSSALWVSRNGATLYVSGQEIAKTSDGGATWADVDVPDGASLVEIDPDDPEVLYAAVHDGEAVRVWLSRDGGATWTRP